MIVLNQIDHDDYDGFRYGRSKHNTENKYMNANICQLNTYRSMRGWTSIDQLFWYEWPSCFPWDAHLPLRKVELCPGPQATPTVLFSLNRGVHICSLNIFINMALRRPNRQNLVKKYQTVGAKTAAISRGVPGVQVWFSIEKIWDAVPQCWVAKRLL